MKPFKDLTDDEEHYLKQHLRSFFLAIRRADCDFKDQPLEYRAHAIFCRNLKLLKKGDPW